MFALRHFCPDPLAESRILNALWRELHPHVEPRPRGWQPSQREVLALNLRIIQGFGDKSRAIVQAWLRQSPASPSDPENRAAR
jgi:hypothetical protein